MEKVKDNLTRVIASFLVSAVAISVFSILEFLFALKTTSYTEAYTGYITIMNTNYFRLKDDYPPRYFIDNYSDKIAAASSVFKDNLYNITGRLKYKASLISSYGEASIIAYGIDKSRDYTVFKDINNIIIGDTLTKESAPNSIVIGNDLSIIFYLDIGDSVILRLITKDGYYKASEYNIIGISDFLRDGIILMDMNNLADLANIKGHVSEIDINPVSDSSTPFLYEKYDSLISGIFSNNINLYPLQDMHPELLSCYNFFLDIIRYIVYVYALSLFSIYIFINSTYLNFYKKSRFLGRLISDVIFSNLGFVLSIIFSPFFSKFLATVILIDGFYFKLTFKIIYLTLFLINIVVILLSNFILYLYRRLSIGSKIVYE